MSVKALFVVLGIALAVVVWPSQGRAEKAEKVTTNQTTNVYSHAGEQSAVVLKVKSGQTMTLLAKDGRWLKVRVSGRTGWIPRSKVDMPDDDEDLARNTRRRPFVDGRGTKRGFGGETGPEDRVGADATGAPDDEPRSKPDRPARTRSKADRADNDDAADDEARPRARKPSRRDGRDADAADDEAPARTSKARDKDDDEEGKSDAREDAREDAKEDARPMAHVARRTAVRSDPDKNSEEAFTADPRTALYVVGEKGDWTYVENDEGDGGYVLTSKLEIEEPGSKRTRVIDLRGRLGFALVRQSVATPGGMNVLPDNYSASSSSITIALGATVLVPYSKRYWLGGELAYDYDNAVLGGISYMGVTTSFTFHNVNLRAVGGYDLGKSNGMVVFGRLGYHYDSFQVADVEDISKNTAKLPSQIVSGPTLGGALAIPRLTKDLGLRVSLDTMLFGAGVQQTKGLEDGVGPSAKAVYLGGSITYRWKPRMDLQATYDLFYTSVSFSGPPPDTSMRGHTAMTTSSGSDLNHTVSAGVAYAF
jgi:uncharacterized protein YgiM (DUF1202 family)